jgi:hypothetical protein
MLLRSLLELLWLWLLLIGLLWETTWCTHWREVSSPELRWHGHLPRWWLLSIASLIAELATPAGRHKLLSWIIHTALRWLEHARYVLENSAK